MPTTACLCTASKARRLRHLLQDPGDHRIQRQMFLSMTGPGRTVVRRFLDLFDRAGPIFKSADIIDLVVTHILEDLPGERRTNAGSAIEENGLFLIEILVVVWRVRGGAKFQHSA